MKFHITEIDATRIKCYKCQDDSNFATMRISLGQDTKNSCDTCLAVVIREMSLFDVVSEMSQLIFCKVGSLKDD